uniref:TRADD-like N-terminal domain-containing protein n=1 Tax=Branchiostoma floridae TaxID=7739 RepID=C3Y8G7_BRAFL|eukprot:XP_002607394.1 hypothetical protein BRAFLDRAFT_69805 [Branchiostoma floridae]
MAASYAFFSCIQVLSMFIPLVLGQRECIKVEAGGTANFTLGDYNKSKEVELALLADGDHYPLDRLLIIYKPKPGTPVKTEVSADYEDRLSLIDTPDGFVAQLKFVTVNDARNRTYQVQQAGYQGPEMCIHIIGPTSDDVRPSEVDEDIDSNSTPVVPVSPGVTFSSGKEVRKHDPPGYGEIVGIVFGIGCFIAVVAAVAAIMVYLFRHRRDSQPQDLILTNNQPQNPIPPNNQPQNPIPPNNQPQNLIPPNSQPQNPIPPNNQPQNPIPPSNQPQNPIPPSNQPQNPIPPSNQPQNPIPPSNQPLNQVLTNGQAHDPVPANGQPPHLFPVCGQPQDQHANPNQNCFQGENNLNDLIENILKTEVLQDPENFEAKLVQLNNLIKNVSPFFSLSLQAKLHLKYKFKSHVCDLSKAAFSRENVERYDRMADVFANFCATLKKVEDGCILCTLEFVDVEHLKSFLRSYRDGKLSEALAQVLITEEMKRREGADLYIDVKLLVERVKASSCVGAKQPTAVPVLPPALPLQPPAELGQSPDGTSEDRSIMKLQQHHSEAGGGSSLQAEPEGGQRRQYLATLR